MSASAEQVDARKLYEFLARVSPAWHGAGEFFELMERSPALRRQYNELIQNDPRLRALAEEGNRFWDGLDAHLERDFPVNDSLRGYAIDPQAAISKSLRGFLQSQRGETERPIPPYLARNQALSAIRARYQLPSEIQEDRLRMEHPAAYQEYVRVLLRKEQQTTKVSGAVSSRQRQFEAWKTNTVRKVDDARARNLRAALFLLMEHKSLELLASPMEKRGTKYRPAKGLSPIPLPLEQLLRSRITFRTSSHPEEESPRWDLLSSRRQSWKDSRGEFRKSLMRREPIFAPGPQYPNDLGLLTPGAKLSQENQVIFTFPEPPAREITLSYGSVVSFLKVSLKNLKTDNPEQWRILRGYLIEILAREKDLLAERNFLQERSRERPEAFSLRLANHEQENRWRENQNHSLSERRRHSEEKQGSEPTDLITGLRRWGESQSPDFWRYRDLYAQAKGRPLAPMVSSEQEPEDASQHKRKRPTGRMSNVLDSLSKLRNIAQHLVVIAATSGPAMGLELAILSSLSHRGDHATDQTNASAPSFRLHNASTVTMEESTSEAFNKPMESRRNRIYYQIKLDEKAGRHSGDGIPRYFNLAKKFDSGFPTAATGKSDYWIESKVPHFANTYRELPLPSPDDGDLGGIEVKDADGKPLILDRDYTVLKVTNGPYYLKLDQRLPVSVLQRPLSFKVGFSSPAPSVTRPDHAFETLDPNRVAEIAGQMRVAGFTQLGNAILATASAAQRENRAFTIRELSQVFSDNALYSSRPEGTSFGNKNRFSPHSRFVKNGVAHWQCDGANQCFKEFLDAYFRDGHAGVQIENRSCFVREPGNEFLTGAQAHLRTAVYTSDRRHLEMYDATASEKEKTRRSSEEPLPVVPPERARFHLVTESESKPEPRRKRPWQGPPEESGDSEELTRELATARARLTENPAFQALPRSLHHHGIPSSRALELATLLEKFHSATVPESETLRRIRLLYPAEAATCVSAACLPGVLKRIADTEAERMEKMKARIASGGARRFASFGNDYLLDPIRELFELFASRDWKPRSACAASLPALSQSER